MKIGITGVIASGKSTILNRLKSLGYKTIDIDYIVNELYKREDVINLINNNFNCVIDNKIDKKILGEIIFNNEEKRMLLNSLVHPLIKRYIDELDDELIFIEVPLLFEAKMENQFDKIILIYLSRNESISRLCKRNGLSVLDAIKRVDSQISCDKKIELSDYVIDNSKSIEDSYNHLDKILKEIKNGN